MKVITPTADKVLAETLARRMHPDLDWPSPSDEVKEKLSRYEMLDRLEDLARVYADINIPEAAYFPSDLSYCSQGHYGYVDENGKEVEWSEGEYQYIVDVEATKKTLAKGMRALKRLGAKIEKNYTDTEFVIKATFASGLVYKLRANRQVVCKKRVVGRKYVEGTAGRYVDEVEWDCEKIPLSAISVD